MTNSLKHHGKIVLWGLALLCTALVIIPINAVSNAYRKMKRVITIVGVVALFGFCTAHRSYLSSTAKYVFKKLLSIMNPFKKKPEKATALDHIKKMLNPQKTKVEEKPKSAAMLGSMKKFLPR